MADTASALGIKTLVNGGVVAKLVDTAGTNTLTIDTNGAALVTGDMTVDGSVSIVSGTNTLVIDTNGAIAVTGDITATVDGLVGISSGINTLTIDTNGAASVIGSVEITSGTNTLAIDTNGYLTITGDVTATVDGSVSIASGTNTLTIDTNGAASVVGSMSLIDGTNSLAIDSNGAISVVVTETAATFVVDYGTSAAVAQDAEATFDYVVTNAKTFTGASVLVGSRGATKVSFGTWDGTTFTTLGVYFQGPGLNKEVEISKLQLLGDGTDAIRVVVKNLDSATDLYCTIQGEEK